MALKWMKSTLRCALAAGVEGRKLLLAEWRLLDFMEVRPRFWCPTWLCAVLFLAWLVCNRPFME
jgi:hypothetical protein